MAETGRLTRAPGGREPALSPVTRLRIAIIVAVLVIWELVAASGLLFRDVVPSLASAIAGRRCSDRGTLESSPDASISNLWHHVLARSAIALAIGGLSGLAVGMLLGANPFLAQAFERYLYYLGPTPKIVFFPVMIMWFGVGPGIQDRAWARCPASFRSCSAPPPACARSTRC